MLAPDVHFEGWDLLDWIRLLSLFEGSFGSPQGLFVLHDGKVIRKLLHTKIGRLDPGTQSWGDPLEELARAHGTDWVLGMHLGALEELMERLGARLLPSDDLLAQLWKCIEILQELAQEAAIASWPIQLQGRRLPSLLVIRQGLDVLCPPGKVIAMGLFEQGELWTSLVISRQSQGIDRILGPERLREMVGLLSGDFRRDYWHLKRVIQQQFGPLHLGLFTEVKTLRRLLTEGRPGSWARSVTVRDVIIAPNPAAIVLPLGVDAVRGLTHSLIRVATRFRMEEHISAMVASVQTQQPHKTPWQALRHLLEKLAR